VAPVHGVHSFWAVLPVGPRAGAADVRIYIQLVKLFTSLSVLSAVQVSRDRYDAEQKPARAASGPNVPPKATQKSSELMTRARRPRARHRVKPFKVG